MDLKGVGVKKVYATRNSVPPAPTPSEKGFPFAFSLLDHALGRFPGPHPPDRPFGNGGALRGIQFRA